MTPFTRKQKIVCVIIRMIEWIVNNRTLVPFLNRVSAVLCKFFFLNRRHPKEKNCLFENLSVAFIADGNRRWLKKTQMKKKPTNPRYYSGLFNEFFRHLQIYVKSKFRFMKTKATKPDLPSGKMKVDTGFKKILEIIKFAYLNNFKEVSFFCFAIGNFNRPKNDISEIMDYIKNAELFDHSLPIQIKIYGRIHMLDPEVRDKLKKISETYSMKAKLLVNLFIGYSSSADEADAINKFDNDIDLLIRTSGEKRLSDFLVNQVARGTSVDFVNPYWPEFSILHLYLTLIKHALERKYLNE